jgi:hypothetical protein
LGALARVPFGGWDGDAMAIVLFLMALAGAAPTADIPGICRAARDGASPERKVAAYEACVHAELAARDELQRRWSQFSVLARSTCERAEAFSISYVEMLTCLELQTDGNIGKSQKPAASGGAPPNVVAPAMPARLGATPNPAPPVVAPQMPERFKN